LSVAAVLLVLAMLFRDIACRNLLVDGDRVRVSDFGLSRALNTQADLLYSAVEFGPVPWMAPESLAADASQRSFSTKSDVHMFGVTLFELFTYGAQPWAGLSPLDIVYRVHAVRVWCALLVVHGTSFRSVPAFSGPKRGFPASCGRQPNDCSAD
jgi:serine/threonine protein kinase